MGCSRLAINSFPVESPTPCSHCSLTGGPAHPRPGGAQAPRAARRAAQVHTLMSTSVIFFSTPPLPSAPGTVIHLRCASRCTGSRMRRAAAA